MPSRKSSSLRDKLAAAPDPSRPATPEPTTSSGVSRGRALYDTPPPDSQTDDLNRSQRRRRSTSRGISWAEEVEKSATRSSRNRRTRARKAKKRAQASTASDAENTDGEPQGTSTNPLTHRSDDEGDETDEVPEPVVPAETQESTAQESTSGAGSSGPNPNYIDRQEFVALASAAMGEDLSNESTQALQHLYDFRNTYETPAVAASSRNSSIVVLEGPPLGVGGGWHLEHLANNSAATTNPGLPSSNPSKRRSTVPDPDSAKRQRIEINVDDSNTDTILESDFELEPLPSPLFQSTPLPSVPRPTVPLTTAPSSELPQPAPPPLGNPVLRTTTQTTQPESQPDPQSPAPQYNSTESLDLEETSNSHHSPFPFTFPPKAPVIARLRAALRAREADLNARYETAQTTPTTVPPPQSQPTSGAQAGANAVPGSRTYLRRRSHLPSDAQAPGSSPQNPTSHPPVSATAGAPAQPNLHSQTTSHSHTTPNSQTTSNSQATARPKPSSHAQPTARPKPSSHAQPTARAQLTSAPRSKPSGPAPSTNPHSSLRPPPTSQPRPSTNSQRQPQRPSQRPPPRQPEANAGTQRSVRGVQDSRPRARDPVATAKADMVAFNHAQREDQERSIAESAARHLEYQEQERARQSPDPPDRLVEDDEEIRECARAAVTGLPLERRPKKKKPRACDSQGLPGLILTLSKLAFFGVVCSAGPYQTRGRLIHWARIVHEETWNAEAPDVPYVAATDGELAVMVNNLATLRGRVKERLRPVIQEGYGFHRFALTQEEVRHNRELCALLTPNNFHCTQYSPRAGHYENGEIFHAVAAALFHGPNSVGALFNEEFQDMSLEVIAFVLAMMQFCIEEWANGWFQAKDLSAGNMLEKYECHLFGLKEAFAVAPDRIYTLQEDLVEFTGEYARASTSHQEGGQERIQRSEIRPDTPPPQQEEEEETVPAEYNQDGRLTARSKGKRRGN